ncbi:unnamed protein product, partial [Ixodes pacificus]
CALCEFSSYGREVVGWHTKNMHKPPNPWVGCTSSIHLKESNHGRGRVRAVQFQGRDIVRCLGALQEGTPGSGLQVCGTQAPWADEGRRGEEMSRPYATVGTSFIYRGVSTCQSVPVYFL